MEIKQRSCSTNTQPVGACMQLESARCYDDLPGAPFVARLIANSLAPPVIVARGYPAAVPFPLPTAPTTLRQMQITPKPPSRTNPSFPDSLSTDLHQGKALIYATLPPSIQSTRRRKITVRAAADGTPTPQPLDNPTF